MDDLPVLYSEAGGFPIDHNPQPIRLFRQDFLEFFTHINPVVVVAIWFPVATWFLLRAISRKGVAGFPIYIPIAILLGIFLWTLTEYFVHRYIFHYHPKTDRMKRVVFLFHGIHHAQPQCKTRLVMPPAVSVPMSFIIYGLFYGLVGVVLGIPYWVDPLVAGFILGYLAYDLLHYATHHFAMRRGLWKYLKRFHMQHHYKTPDQRYGVSMPIWDVVFGTMPEE